MAEAIKILAQANPSATTLTDLYTVPADTVVTASTLAICNRDSSNITVRVSVAIAGASNTPEQYILYDQLILKHDSMFLTIGITLDATDKVRVYTSAATASFNLFGVEVS